MLLRRFAWELLAFGRILLISFLIHGKITRS
jgi:hypothetical protein